MVKEKAVILLLFLLWKICSSKYMTLKYSQAAVRLTGGCEADRWL